MVRRIANPEQSPRPSTASRQRETSPDALPAFDWKQILALARKRLDHYFSLLPKVLPGDSTEAVHDLRVASRRLQQILDLLYPRPRPAGIRKAVRTLRRSRQALSMVRNCDVALQRVDEILANKRTLRREPWQAFRDYLAERREEFFRQASRKLGRLNMSAFYVRTKEELDSLSSSVAEGARIHEVSLGRQIAESLQEVWSELESRVAESREERTTPAMHAVRIASKRLRYRIEVIRELSVSGTEEAVAHLKRLQQRLGDWNDLEVMEDLMLEMIGRPDYLGENLDLAMQIERLVLRNRRGKAARQQQLLRLFEEAAEYRELGGWVDHFLSASSAATEV